MISVLMLAFTIFLLFTLPKKQCPSGCSLYRCNTGGVSYECTCTDGICRHSYYTQNDKYQYLGWKVFLAVGGFGLLSSIVCFLCSGGYDERQHRELQRLTELQIANINAEAQMQCGESVGLVTVDNEAAVMMSVVGVAEAVLTSDYLADLTTSSAIVLDGVNGSDRISPTPAREQQFLMERDELFGVNESVYTAGTPYTIIEAPRDEEAGITELGYYEPNISIVSAMPVARAD